MTHNTYRLPEGNGYAARTFDTFGKENPIMSSQWFFEPRRVRTVERDMVARQLMEHRRSGLPMERTSEEWYEDSEYPNLSAQIRMSVVLDR